MTPKVIASWSKKITEAGGEVLAPTNPYEVLRFRTIHGVGVIYRNTRGVVTWNAQAEMARDHLQAGNGSLARVKVHGRRKASKATIFALMQRDGSGCFFCGDPLAGDITIEHLVSVCHGGPHHVSNLYLAHTACNQTAGHMSAPEKVAFAIGNRA